MSEGRARLSLPELLVALPLGHALISGLFLMSYYWSFGAGIVNFAGPSDLFSVSLRDIGPTYLITLGIPVLFLLWTRGRTGAWTYQDANLNLPPDQVDEAERIRRMQVKWYTRFLWANFVLFAALIILHYFRFGRINYTVMQWNLLIIILFFHSWFSNKLNVDAKIFQLIWLLCMAVVVTIFSGLDRGQNDRLSTYNDVALSGSICQNGAIIRPLANLYLAVLRNNRKAILDAECRVRFVIV